MSSRSPEAGHPADPAVASGLPRRLSGATRTSRATLLALLIASPLGLTAGQTPAHERVLHVMADPNNLPFSNERREGFENKIVELIAGDLGARVEYTWWAQRRGWVRNTFREGPCDLVAGVPAHFGPLLTTAPYYVSSYALVYRRDAPFAPTSLDDPALHRLRIGVQMIGDDFSNTPPAHALSKRGIVQNVRGYTVYGDYTQPNPPARIVDAVLRREIDVACVWGPLAGYFVRQHPELVLVPLYGRDTASAQPFSFAICVGVRKSEPGLRDEVNAILQRRKSDIDAILTAYGVPRSTPATAAAPGHTPGSAAAPGRPDRFAAPSLRPGAAALPANP